MPAREFTLRLLPFAGLIDQPHVSNLQAGFIASKSGGSRGVLLPRPDGPSHHLRGGDPV
jgi:hypothetical protein